MSTLRKQRYTRKEVEKSLEDKFKGIHCSFTYPGYPTVYGMVDSIALELERGAPIVVLVMHEKRYTVSLESLHDCLNIL